MWSFWWLLGWCKYHHLSFDHNTRYAKSSGCCKIHSQNSLLWSMCVASNFCTSMYRVSQLVADLGWVDLNLDVPPSCPLPQPLLPTLHHPRQNLAVSGTLNIQVNTIQSTTNWDTLYLNGFYFRFFSWIVDFGICIERVHDQNMLKTFGWVPGWQANQCHRGQLQKLRHYEEGQACFLSVSPSPTDK